MVTIKKLSDLTMEEATDIWNAGFEGYIYDQKRTVDSFVQRFGQEDLLPSLSVVAYVDDEPAGLILSGVREIGGKKVGWNGGTGVATQFRRQGIGKVMMDTVLKLYRENGVEMATLEAAKSNEKAIKLYQQFGYEVIDELTFLQHKGSLHPEAFATDRKSHYEMRKGTAQDAQYIKFMNNTIPWQTHWSSLRKDGQLLVLSDKGEDVAYFLYKKTINSEGKVTSSTLFSAGIQSDRHDAETIAKYGIREIWYPAEDEYTRMTFNFPHANKEIIKLLQGVGFTSYAEQVHMTKSLNEKE